MSALQLTAAATDLPVRACKNTSRRVSLSHQQETFWEAEQQGTVGYRVLDWNTRVANAFAAVRVEGRWDLAVLQRALNEVLRRHEALRLRFETTAGRTLQCITDADEVPLECLDVSGKACVDREHAAADLAASTVLGRFSHSAGVLLRAHAIRIAEHDTIVVMVVPHVISDAASMQVVVREVLTLYAHYLHDLPSPLPQPAVQYADYVQWQRAWIQSGILDAVGDELVGRLAGAQPLRLPLSDRAYDDPTDVDAAELKFRLDDRQLAAVRTIAARARVTPFVVMLSAFDVLLSRWTGLTDVLLLAPFAARPDASTRETIGLFSNLCPLRADLSDNPRFADVLEQVQETVLRTMRFRCVPHRVLAECLRGHADISCTGVGVNAVPDGGNVMPPGCRPLFGDETRLSPYVVDTSARAVRLIRGHLSFWVGFAAAASISGRLIYRRASFEAETIQHLARMLVDSLDAFAMHPDRRVFDEQV